MMSQETREWLDEVRGIDPELADALGLATVRRRNGGEALAIPYRRAGELLGRKFRAIGEKDFACDKGMEKDLWNVDCLYDETLADQPVIITEGELDALSCIQAGHVRAVSIPDGWTEGLEGESGEGAKVAPLTRNADQLRRSPCVIVAGDNDATGQSFVRAVANILEGHIVRYCEWPDGCKDPNDVLRKHGEGKLTECIGKARLLDPPGGMITALSDLPPALPRTLWRTGIEAIDRVVCFERGALSVGTGYPGHGKSTFARFCAWRLTREHDLRVGLLEMETAPAKIADHVSRLEAGRPLQALSKHEREPLFARLDRHWRVLHRVEDETSHDMGWLKRMLHTAAVRDQVGWVVIDPWNEIEHMLQPGESMTNYHNVALSKLRQWADRYGIHILVNAHPRKPKDESEPATGYSIADSAAWANKPSMGFTVFHDSDQNETRIYNWKTRDRELYGTTPGMYRRLQFDPQKMVYRGVI